MDKIIYNIALVGHIVGISIMAGATFIDRVNFRRFWKALPADRPAALFMADFSQRLQRLSGIGLLILILSGVGMMAFLHQVWGQQTWFRIKMGILILIIINGRIIRGRLGNNLKKLLANDSGMDAGPKLAQLKKNITLTLVIQTLFFLAIFVLSVFKFN